MPNNKPIYRPGGRAAEYSPWALNVYAECAHGCDYCYNRRYGRCSVDAPEPRGEIVERIERQLEREPIDGQVMLSFMGDPYGPATDGNATTRAALELLLAHQTPAAILTKAGRSCLKDRELFERFGTHVQVGASLTFHDGYQSDQHEPRAASPAERMQTLEVLHWHGIRTFASLEPVYDPYQTLAIIHDTLPYVDAYMIGRLNGDKGHGRWDYGRFLRLALDELRDAGKLVYVKESMAFAAPEVELMPEERDPARVCVTWPKPGALAPAGVLAADGALAPASMPERDPRVAEAERAFKEIYLDHVFESAV